MRGHESAKAIGVANVILAGGGLFCLLCLLYVVHRYGLTGQGQFVSDAGPLVYYLVPGVSSVLLFGSLLLSPSIKVGLALVLSSTAISLYSVELVLQVMNHLRFQDQRTLWTPTTQDDLDELVRMMHSNPYYEITIHAHCNGKNKREIITLGSNKNYFDVAGAVKVAGSAKDLTAMRAEAIRAYLVENGIDAKRTKIFAWGGSDMLVKGTSPNANLNDRIEIEFTRV